MPDRNHPAFWMYEPHYAALGKGRLAVQRCSTCQARYWPPVERCPSCGSVAFDAAEVPTHGTVHTYTVMHDDRGSWFAEHTPYGIVVVDLEPSVRAIGWVTGPQVSQLDCGVPVRAVFEEVDEMTLLRWDLQTGRGS